MMGKLLSNALSIRPWPNRCACHNAEEAQQQYLLPVQLAAVHIQDPKTHWYNPDTPASAQVSSGTQYKATSVHLSVSFIPCHRRACPCSPCQARRRPSARCPCLDAARPSCPPHACAACPLHAPCACYRLVPACRHHPAVQHSCLPHASAHLRMCAYILCSSTNCRMHSSLEMSLHMSLQKVSLTWLPSILRPAGHGCPVVSGISWPTLSLPLLLLLALLLLAILLA